MRIDEPNIESMKVDYSRHLPLSSERVELTRIHLYKKENWMFIWKVFPFFLGPF